MPRVLLLFFLFALHFPSFAQDEPLPGEYHSLDSALAHPKEVRILKLQFHFPKKRAQELTRFPNLEVLDLSYSGLRKLPPVIFELTQLKELHIPEQKLSGLPQELANLTQLEVLDISANNFLEIPAVVFELTNLRELYCLGAFDYIGLFNTDSVLRELSPKIAQLQKLEVLSLAFNGLGQLPPELAKMGSLKVLGLAWNTPDQEALRTISQLSQLETLDLDGSGLENLPPEMANLTNLKHLYLDTQFTEGAPGWGLDTFPMVITQMTNLEELTLAGNCLKRLPPEIGKLTRLRYLGLFANCFTEIPEEMAQLTELEYLNLDLLCLGGMNDFCEKSFALPRDLCNWKKLKTLGLEARIISEADRERMKCLSSLTE